MADLYFFALEVLFYYASSNEALLAISALVMGITALVPLSGRLPGRAGSLARPILANLVALPALLAQAYLLAFALQTQGVYVTSVIVGGAVGAWLLAQRLPLQDGPRPTLDRAPLPFSLFLVGVYLFLGLVMGHLATPIVHGVATFMAGLSLRAWPVYHLVTALLLLLPVAVWIPALIRAPSWLGRTALAASAVAALSLIPGPAGVYVAGVAAAVATVAAAAAGGLLPIRTVHPAPRAIAAQLLLISLLATNAVTVHYAAVMWRCPRGEVEGIRRISDWAGTFDLAPLARGERLLVSLREPRRVAELDLTTGEPLWVADTGKLMEGTGHLFSWVEPETILALAGGERALLLLAVSDDEGANRVISVDSGRGVGAFLDDLPRTSISDLIDDGQGHPLVSTEFDGEVIALDPDTLSVTHRVRWPEAETNKILAPPGGGRLYSLGLWNDPFLRSLDLASGEETASLEVGTRSWDLALDPVEGRLFVPRLVDGELLVVDAESLELVDRWPLAFGARPVEVDAGLRRLIVGNMYQGDLRIHDLDSGEQLARLHLGGYIKGLSVDPVRHKAYTGCACGIYEIDLEAF